MSYAGQLFILYKKIKYIFTSSYTKISLTNGLIIYGLKETWVYHLEMVREPELIVSKKEGLF